MKYQIYADNAATTKLDNDAYAIMNKCLRDVFYNASQPYLLAKKSKKMLNEAREKIAKCINALPEEIYFTSGGTESNNWVIKQYTNPPLYKIITSQIEHNSIINSCKAMEKLGYNVTYLKPNKYGLIKPNALIKAIDKSTRLVSIMHMNNELGTIQDIKNLCKIAHENNVYFHTDAVQSMGHIPIDVKDLNIDFLSASAHKFNGPKGIGFLYIKKGCNLCSLLNGGQQENNLRAGTENIPAIIAMAIALENNCKHLHDNIEKIKDIKRSFFEGLNLDIKYVRNGLDDLSGIINLSFENYDGESILHQLDLMGITISTGSACDSQNKKASHVLQAIGLPKILLNGTIRISFNKDNSIQDAIDIAGALNKIFSKNMIK
ncbi:cysteine desulfurase [bacterium]|nr:cysteine desulfurase [bacterium]